MLITWREKIIEITISLHRMFNLFNHPEQVFSIECQSMELIRIKIYERSQELQPVNSVKVLTPSVFNECKIEFE